MESCTLKLRLGLFKYSLPRSLYSHCRHINTSVPKPFFRVVFRLNLTSETFALHLPLCLCSPSWLSNAHLFFPFFPPFCGLVFCSYSPSPNLPFLLLLLLFRSTPLSLNVPFLEKPRLGATEASRLAVIPTSPRCHCLPSARLSRASHFNIPATHLTPPLEASPERTPESPRGKGRPTVFYWH